MLVLICSTWAITTCGNTTRLSRACALFSANDGLCDVAHSANLPVAGRPTRYCFSIMQAEDKRHSASFEYIIILERELKNGGIALVTEEFQDFNNCNEF